MFLCLETSQMRTSQHIPLHLWWKPGQKTTQTQHQFTNPCYPIRKGQVGVAMSICEQLTLVGVHLCVVERGFLTCE